MRNLLTSLIMVSLAIGAQSQEHKPQLLTEPADWAFERFELPPSFAPEIPYKGAEELRFSPGMFKKDTVTYFTYTFVAQLNDVTTISQNDIRDYILKYFKGLCSVVAKDRKLIIDTSVITGTVEKKRVVAATDIIYNASVNMFGVFTDGAPLKLNMEVKVLVNATMKKTYLLFIISPRDKTDAVWNKLYEIQKKFTPPK